MPLNGDNPHEVGDWTNSLYQALAKLIEALQERPKDALRLEGFSTRLGALEARLDALENEPSSVVPITTFEPEPFEVVKEIKAVVQPSDGEYLASFFDANVNAAGRNPVDAVENLKDTLLSRFDYLDGLPPERLGPGPAKQIAVLRSFIRRRA